MKIAISLIVVLMCSGCQAQDNATSITESPAISDDLFTVTESNSDLTTISDYVDDYENSDDTSEPFKVPQNPTEFMIYFEELLTSVRTTVDNVFEKYMPMVFQLSSRVVMSPECTMDLLRTLIGVREMKPWALRFLDASGKLPDGVLSGTLSSLGAYDECLEMKLGEEGIIPGDSLLTMGQYCSVSIKPFLPPKPPIESVARAFSDAADAQGFAKNDHFARYAPLFYYMKFRLGVCVPSTCTRDDLKAITNNLSSRTKLNVTVGNCEVAENFMVSTEQLVAGGILALVTVAVVAATVVDIVRKTCLTQRLLKATSSTSKSVGQLFTDCWLSFSAYANSSRLMTTKVPDDAVHSIYGLRVLCLIWIILAHAYMTLDLKAVGHLARTQEVIGDILFQMVMNASLAVETFFFISGVLVTMVALKRLHTGQAVKVTDWLWFYFHRLVRMTPAVMLVIAIVLATYQVSNGPLWREIIYPAAQRCRDNWWIHLLHISNFFDLRRMCFLHLWYIAADVQLFLFTPPILLLLFRKPQLGKFLMVVLTMMSMVATGLVTYTENLPPTLLFHNPDPLSRKAYGDTILIKPYPHAAPYLVGMLTGYLLFTKGSKIRLTAKVATAGWFCTLVTCMTLLFSTIGWNRGNYPSQLVSALYAATFRSLWSLAMAWVVVACAAGHGGFINTLLTWRPFVPLSRISFVAYLIHPGLMYIFVASTRNLFMFSHFLIMYMFLSHLVSTFVVSFFLTMFIELPFIGVSKAIHHYVSNDSRCKYYYTVNPVQNLNATNGSKAPMRICPCRSISTDSNSSRQVLQLSKKFDISSSMDSISKSVYIDSTKSNGDMIRI
ncbi:Nose resistant to fluoxetine protein 6 [Halotydeus destructor]|nr:Nose resistant to fluoxetine protein 6 [Halotydeus destructor]